jgi:predicted nucleotidyltransferase
MTKEEILRTLESVKDEVRREFKAEIKGIFGSYSRAEENEQSDIDVLVNFFEGATLFDLSGLGNFLELKLQCKVDIVSQRALREEIKANVYQDLVEI